MKSFALQLCLIVVAGSAQAASGNVALRTIPYIGVQCPPLTSLHYSAGLGAPAVVTGTSNPMGFNLFDLTSQAACDALASGQCLLYLGDSTYDSATQAIITATATDPKVLGYYILDEPADAVIPVLKQYVDYIHTNAPTKYSFFVMENDSSPTAPSYFATPTNTDMTTSLDIVGIDPYPVRIEFSGGINLNVINLGVTEALTVGWSRSQIIPVYQAFGGPLGSAYESWTLPNAAQGFSILSTWSLLTPSPVFDYTYAWSQQLGDYPLGGGTGESADIQARTIQLQQVYAAHNNCL